VKCITIQIIETAHKKRTETDYMHSDLILLFVGKKKTTTLFDPASTHMPKHWFGLSVERVL